MSTAYYTRGCGCQGATTTADPTATIPPRRRRHRWRHWFSRFWRRRCGHPTQRLIERLTEQLALDDTQHAILVRLMSEFALWRADLFKHRIQAGADLRALLAAPPLDQVSVLERVKETTRATEERTEKLIGAFAEFSDSLSEMQRQRLLAWMDRWLGEPR
jgi:hypothetical protein